MTHARKRAVFADRCGVIESPPGRYGAMSEKTGRRDDPEIVPASPEEVPAPSTPPEIPVSVPEESPYAPPAEQPDIDLPEVAPPSERMPIGLRRHAANTAPCWRRAR